MEDHQLDLGDEAQAGAVARYSEEDQSALEAHYDRFLGDNRFRMFHERISEYVHLDIYIYGTSPTRPFVTLATSGMGAADVPRDSTKPTRRSELVTYVPHDWDFSSPEAAWLFARLFELARFPHSSQEVMAKHHTMCIFDERTNLADALFPGSLLTHWYLRSLINEPEEIDHLILPSGQHLNFMWPYPITRHEYYFATQASETTDLEVELATHAPIPIDIHRQCIFSPENRHQKRTRLKEQKRLARAMPKTPWMEIPCDLHPQQFTEPRK
ncbi:suppressor of fused domain protein [Nocardia amamiensis]|uniref:Suppressor of fused domain protein n=1 Tax=Nocardia amamiensis TaxID=404578 RepID=A0ABS0CQW1_9NOCA|nr:suppressor of fused domain protein [Nocardia amamiensis]MBF6298987.1 suppressor of fused domain protein [Nocardia amamiensis]